MTDDEKEWVEILRDTGWEVRETLIWALALMKEYDAAMVGEFGLENSKIYSPKHIEKLVKAERLLKGISGGKTLEAFNLSRLAILQKQYTSLRQKLEDLIGGQAKA